jgi:hypothetical protein
MFPVADRDGVTAAAAGRAWFWVRAADRPGVAVSDAVRTLPWDRAAEREGVTVRAAEAASGTPLSPVAAIDGVTPAGAVR